MLGRRTSKGMAGAHVPDSSLRIRTPPTPPRGSRTVEGCRFQPRDLRIEPTTRLEAPRGGGASLAIVEGVIDVLRRFHRLPVSRKLMLISFVFVMPDAVLLTLFLLGIND